MLLVFFLVIFCCFFTSGIIVVLGIIGVTLFPLWPPSVRVGVYYLSICGGAFVGAILVIAAGE